MSLPPANPFGTPLTRPSARPFFLPAIGIVFLFAALGPAIGGAAFVPLAAAVEAQSQTVMHIGFIATLIGHALVLIPAYIVGLFPAALTGLAYALYDAWAPPRWPRALVAALIGALFAHLLFGWLGVVFNDMVAFAGPDFSDYVAEWTAGEIDAGLYYALVLSGAVAALACAALAGLLGVTTRRKERQPPG